MKRLKVGFILMLLSVTLIFASCSSATSGSDAKTSIGIVQIIEHPALDAARKGFVEALKDGGYEDGKQVSFDYQNAQGSRDTLTTIAQKFVNDKKDLIFAIATPSAQAVAQQTTSIPIIITAVTDPVDAGIVDSLEKPGTNVTGTTDMNPVEEQLKLVKKIKPNAKIVGIIYNTGEPNSEVQIEIAKKVAPALGLELELVGITNTSEVKQAADTLGEKVDAIYVPTDNTVVASLEAVLMVAESKKIPVVAGEGDSVKNGALVTYGLDYYKLGYQTGEMAIKVLKGEAKPEDLSIESQKDIQLYVNKSAAQKMGVTLPQELLDNADVIIE